MNDPDPKEKPPVVAIVAIASTLLATLGFVGYRTFANVSESGYVVSVTAHDRSNLRPTSARPPQPPPRHEIALATHERKPRAAVPSPSALPSPSATPSAAPSASPPATPSAKPTLVAIKPTTAPQKLQKPQKKFRSPLLDAASEISFATPAPHPRSQPTRLASTAAAAPGNNAGVNAAAPNTPAPAQATPAVAATAQTVALAPPVYAPERVVEARVRNAVQPEYPSDPDLVGTKATSVVLVTIGPSGRVIRSVVERSSGYGAFDRAAITAARATEYLAPNIDGHPATETYRMVYEFR